MEKTPTPLRPFRGPKILERISSMQTLGHHFFELVLFVPNNSPLLRYATQEVCVIDCVQLGAFSVSVRIAESIFAEKQPSQVEIIPKQLIVPVERGRDPESRFIMVDRLLDLALGVIYSAKETVTSADHKLIAPIRKEIDRSGCGCFCSVKPAAFI